MSYKNSIRKSHGPYVTRQGRTIIVIVYKSGKKKTISNARHIIQLKLDRELTKEETVDHINGNILDDKEDNLQILTRGDNIRKSNRTPMMTAICKCCKRLFQLELRRYKRNQITLMADGPFCSKECVGKIYH